MNAENTPARPARKRPGEFRRLMARRFNLLSDKAPDDIIERRIREGVELQGATPWILIFAILVAAIGLNVNSTAVVIGAMLISPLMGPIMGVGHGVAVHDFGLLRRALLNLALSTVIGLVVSALYFMLTPLSEAQSELLARTSPTLWDVLIALFGGMAGIIGVTREEKSNVIPGMAIATALMPPLCTAGYGLATREWRWFGGAFYLYSINCVFIALATFIGIRLLRLPRQSFVDARTERRVGMAMWLVAVATLLPSIYLAVNLVKDEVYRARAGDFVREAFAFRDAFVVDTRIDASARVIDVSLVGNPVSNENLTRIESRLAPMGLAGTRIRLHQTRSNEPLDVGALRTQLLGDVIQQGQATLADMERKLKAAEQALHDRNAMASQAAAIADELRAQEPGVGMVGVSQGSRIDADGNRQPLVQLTVASPQPLAAESRERILRWFRVRSGDDQAEVVFRGQ
ncbi:DUF389 domain-containing protein [Lysobacter oculi]|uniref:DUF389 domain-containing protein n=1 Tax=Solilutibacter oculi TaxID=2698682 RepID=A0A344J6H8_9GAMM|nr:DUF389 domain-containing protein [Lysobacter oculi]AXA84638.1 DUF389 domain-containing protein [Lysobacter oculi]